MKHVNQLTPAQAERLALLLEELGEAQQVIGKILRHGYESVDPTKFNADTNRELLMKELADVSVARDYLVVAGDLRDDRMRQYAVAKTERVGRYLHHQGESAPPRLVDLVADDAYAMQFQTMGQYRSALLKAGCD